MNDTSCYQGAERWLASCPVLGLHVSISLLVALVSQVSSQAAPTVESERVVRGAFGSWDRGPLQAMANEAPQRGHTRMGSRMHLNSWPCPGWGDSGALKMLGWELIGGDVRRSFLAGHFTPALYGAVAGAVAVSRRRSKQMASIRRRGRSLLVRLCTCVPRPFRYLSSVYTSAFL